MTTRTSRRGGPRNGSGRPRKPPEERKVVATLRLTPRAAEFLRQHRNAVQQFIEEKALSKVQNPKP